MNQLQITETGLLGSEEAELRLSALKSATVLAISDTHGHYGVFEAIVKDYGPRSDALLFSGDGMWDIVLYIENALEDSRLLSALPPVVAFVAGNGDGGSYRIAIPAHFTASPCESQPRRIIPVPARQTIWVAGSGILLAHGHRHSVDVSPEVLVESARAHECAIAVFGHTHKPFFGKYGKVHALNPGSAARPRGGSSAGFALLSIESSGIDPQASFYKVTQGFTGRYGFEPTLL